MDAQYTSIFHFYDSDADGFLSPREFANALRVVGGNPTGAEVDTLLAGAGAGAGGLHADRAVPLSFFLREAVPWALQHTVPSVEELKGMFNPIDRRGESAIDSKALLRMLQSFGEPLSQEEAENFEAMLGGTGKHSFHHIAQTLLKPTKSR
uniref:EF-hand domain-containing protein n=1 Tax=Chromera velia CCMP2878 TaxID=1169474 RepID=A0A0G4F7P9_9ALVE|eukprot:Cvel_2895.t1-p1 / transcript=Cvel_2895.t1 / gene=Cvel_2895 / organism=Chromera_velia_CCMP2878 / gene_product=Calmodulin, putative / transcript_product=Calmodulin, putative / location=Cvel_scaffold114:85855-87846(+) / protein_length=150 / sequence_SO=supercontig / SO=protein_coding / is_pseudo=false